MKFQLNFSHVTLPNTWKQTQKMSNNGLDQFSYNVFPNCNLKPIRLQHIYMCVCVCVCVWEGLTAFTFLSRSIEAQYLKSAVRISIMFLLVVFSAWNVMEHVQKPDFVFRRNRRVHLNGQGRQFSRLLAAEVCASAVVMLDAPCSEVVWGISIPTPPISPSLPLPCVTVCHHISTGFKQNCRLSVMYNNIQTEYHQSVREY
jgi:hypothetical protein